MDGVFRICNSLFQVAGTVGSRKDIREPGAPHQELKKQVEGLNESLFKVESQRDEFSVKVELLEKQLEESQTKEAELQVINARYKIPPFQDGPSAIFFVSCRNLPIKL